MITFMTKSLDLRFRFEESIRGKKDDESGNEVSEVMKVADESGKDESVYPMNMGWTSAAC